MRGPFRVESRDIEGCNFILHDDEHGVIVGWASNETIANQFANAPALESRNADLLAMVRELEWAGFHAVSQEALCRSCGMLRSQGHTPTCRLAALLRENTPTKGAADER